MATRRIARVIAGLTVLTTAFFGVTPLGASAGGVNTTWFATSAFSSSYGCNECHGGGSTPTVTIYGAPSYMNAGATNCLMYTRVTGGQSAYSGFLAFSTSGNLTKGGYYPTYTEEQTGQWGTEVTHSSRQAYTTYYSWCFTAPSSAGTYYIYVWGNSVDGTGSTNLDRAAISSVGIPVCMDYDGDGYYSSGSPAACPGTRDCDDYTYANRPGATEICDNEDDDCDGSVDEGCDNDNDGYCDSGMTKGYALYVSTCSSTGYYATVGDDCDDTNAAVSPGDTEICNNIDDDCNGSPAIDEGCDDDNDNYCDSGMTKAAVSVSTCTSTSSGATVGNDCNDNNSAIYPNGAAETCSNTGVDNDCDGASNELTDGVTTSTACATGNYGVCSAGTRYCNGAVLSCAQTTAAGTESCSNVGTDNDCDNDTSELQTGSPDIFTTTDCSTGNLGICAAGKRGCTGGALVCNQTNSIGTETCSDVGTDNDCDGDTTELNNTGTHAGDACSTGLSGVCSAGTRQCVSNAVQCVQTTASSAEVCDGLDNNCNGSVDEGCDDDNDDYCDKNMTRVGTPPTCLSGGNDCDDTCVTCTPVGTEICDGKDNDCDNTADDNIAANTCGLGVCQATATACVGGVPQGCTPGTPGTETCSNTGVDNDCDGDTTELNPDVHTGDACTTGLPGICSAGTRYCNGANLACQQTTAMGTELCANTGTDNDCDGDASELTDNIHAGDACSTGNQGVCSAGTYACQGGMLTCVQTNTASAETCLNVGIDNDCDGNPNELTDGVFQNDACTSGQPGECSAGKRSCSGGSLICIANKTPVSEFCDGKDNNCDGQTDNGLPNIECGVGECKKSVPACAGGANNTCTPGAAVAEACDDKDNDCNGTVDNGCDDDGDDYCDDDMAFSGNPDVCPFGAGDCDDDKSSTRPGATELCDGADNDCNGTEDDDVQALTCGVGECQAQASGCVDGVPENCVPKAATAEVCDNLDNDCDGSNDNGVPLSTCGVGECARTGTTCFAESCAPGAPTAEVCDGKDNDCNGVADNGIPLATCGLGICVRTGTTCSIDSCTPGTPSKEICDGQDNDCNGVPDDSLPVAECGEGECHAVGTTCLPSSCVPLEPSAEKCDGKDNDCDGEIDDGCDDDNDGYCDYSLEFVDSPLCPYGGDDCDDLLADSHPEAAELCDDKDNDCNGTVDDNVTQPTCGVGACKALGTACVNGQAENCSPSDPTEETCDGVDNDCDGIIDNGLQPLHCGQGACAVEMVSCRQGEPVECVPREPTAETCDGVDNDCNGTVDEGEALCPAGPCVAGVCTHFLENMGGSSSTGGGIGFGGGVVVTDPPASLGGGSPGGSSNDLLPGTSHEVKEDGGCGCRMVGVPPSNAGWALSLIASLYWARRRRRLAEESIQGHGPGSSADGQK